MIFSAFNKGKKTVLFTINELNPTLHDVQSNDGYIVKVRNVVEHLVLEQVIGNENKIQIAIQEEGSHLVTVTNGVETTTQKVHLLK